MTDIKPVAILLLTALFLVSVAWGINATMNYRQQLERAEYLASQADSLRSVSDSLYNQTLALSDRLAVLVKDYNDREQVYQDNLITLREDAAENEALALSLESQLHDALDSSQRALLERYIIQKDNQILALQGQVGLLERRHAELSTLFNELGDAYNVAEHTIEAQRLTINRQRQAIEAYSSASQSGIITKLWDGITSPLGLGTIAAGTIAAVIIFN